MRGFSRGEARVRAEEAVRRFGIDYSNRIASTLSSGMVRKMLLAMILSANARIYYLDEPTVGLDVRSRVDLWGLLRERARDSVIILTSHYLNEISSVCDKVLLLKSGRIVDLGSPEELVHRHLPGIRSKIVVLGELGGVEEQLDRGYLVRRAGRNIYIYTRSRSEEGEAVERLRELGLPFRMEEPSIEDLFIVGDLG